MSCNTPVIFLIFRRPDLTAQVFETIRQAQPKTLLVVADGPRNEDETILCQQARAVTEQIDWDCEVLRNYSETNLGSRERPASGITWAFEQVEEAIILEDDCLPVPSFFSFCQTLLEYYQHDSRIMLISGSNFIQNYPNFNTKESYFFSKYGCTWGWASWRRAWKFFDVSMRTWKEFKVSNLLPSMFDSNAEQQYWTTIFDETFADIINSAWDYQWLYNRWSQNHLSIVPMKNMVTNIGFGEDATHTNVKTPLHNLPIEDIWDITHPKLMIRDREADCYMFNHAYSSKQPWVNRLKNLSYITLRNKLSWLIDKT